MQINFREIIAAEACIQNLAVKLFWKLSNELLWGKTNLQFEFSVAFLPWKLSRSAIVPLFKKYFSDW